MVHTSYIPDSGAGMFRSGQTVLNSLDRQDMLVIC